MEGRSIIDFALNPTWGGESYPQYSAQASAAAVASPAADGGAGAGSGTGTAEGGSGEGAAPGTGSAGTGGTGTPNPNTENLRVLRENHDRYKGEVEKWGKLGQFEQVQTAHAFYTKMVTEANNLGTQLGYEAEEVAAALKENPEKTLAILRQEAAAASRNGNRPAAPDVNKLIDKRVQELTKPLLEEHNRQLTDKANNAFFAEANRLIDTTYKGADAMPAELKEPFLQIVSDFFAYDEAGIAALKGKGDTAAVQKAFKDATDFMVKVGQGYVKWENARRGVSAGQAQGNGANGNGKPKFTLDDIINGDDAKAKAAGIKSFG